MSQPKISCNAVKINPKLSEAHFVLSHLPKPLITRRSFAYSASRSMASSLHSLGVLYPFGTLFKASESHQSWEFLFLLSICLPGKWHSCLGISTIWVCAPHWCWWERQLMTLIHFEREGCCLTGKRWVDDSIVTSQILALTLQLALLIPWCRSRKN